MKNLFFFIIFFGYQSIFSQFHNDETFKFNKGIIHFKDSTKIEGLVAFRGGDKILYRKEEKASKEKIELYKIDKINIDNFDFFFKLYTKDFNVSKILLKKETEGALEVFSKTKFRANAPMPNGIGGLYYDNEGSYHTSYYLSKKKSKVARKIPTNTKGVTFRKFLERHAKNCPEFLAKIKDKKTMKENFNFNFQTTIDYYNNNCGTIEQNTIK